MNAARCDVFWTESPAVLWEQWMDFFPFTDASKKCTSTALNAFTRFGLYLSVVLTLVHNNLLYLGLGLGFCIIAIAIYYSMKQKGVLREGFENKTLVTPTLLPNEFTQTTNLIGGADVANKVVTDVIGQNDRTNPTAANPFMNALIHEIKDNPQRPPAQSVTTDGMARQFSDVFQTRMYGDPTDVFQHNQDQRVWAVSPNTSIPNDVDSYMNWLYRVPGRTCKEGNNTACRTATEGGVVTWLNAA